MKWKSVSVFQHTYHYEPIKTRRSVLAFTEVRLD